MSIKEHESLLSLFSVIISSVSALAAATALYITSKQLSLMDKERVTPYRVTLYNQRLEGIRLSLDAIARFEDKMFCFQLANTLHSDQTYSNKAYMEKIRQCNQEIVDSLRNLDELR